MNLKGKYSNVFLTIDNIEESAMNIIYNLMNHPAFTNDIAIMPDCHAGKSSCIGFTMKLSERIVPQVVGVDVGCGMTSVNIGKNLPISYSELESYIRKIVPTGMNIHTDEVYDMKNLFPWSEVNKSLCHFISKYNIEFNKNISVDKYSNLYTYDWFVKKCKELGTDPKKVQGSICSLGGGNHFLEFGKSKINDDIWFTVHCGSRNFGLKVCEYHQNIAKQVIIDKRLHKLQAEVLHIRNTVARKDIESSIRNARKSLGLDFDGNFSGLEYLENDDAFNYYIDMIFAQKYAEINRQEIVNAVVSYLNLKVIDRIESIHNFIDFDDLIIRKGAIRSYAGERIIIPFNMSEGMLFCVGKSNAEWNYSAPHGAGRVMSRAEAKRTLSMDDFAKSMEGIYTTSIVPAVLDEAKKCYKDSAMIEAAIEPTATIIDRIVPIINIKDMTSEGKDRFNKKNRNK